MKEFTVQIHEGDLTLTDSEFADVIAHLVGEWIGHENISVDWVEKAHHVLD